MKSISRICKSASLSLNKIGALYNYLDKISMERLVHALISNKLDYCNALLFGLPDRDISRLQSIQNAAARLIFGSRKHEHIVPVLMSLHWLPVKARIEYKILSITYKITCRCCPSYLDNLIHFSKSTYNLRSASSNILQQPRSSYKHYGDRTFSYAAPRLWNSFPENIRESVSVEAYKKHIKTFLFNKYYL